MIPELEEAMKIYTRRGPCGVTIYTTDQDEDILRYHGNVPKDLLLKYFPGKTYGALGGRRKRILAARKKEEAKRAADAKPGDTPPATDPGLAKKQSITKKKKAARKNKWQIPLSAVTQKAEYQAARKLCVKHKKPYPEALKLEEAAKKNDAARKVPAPAPDQAAQEAVPDCLGEARLRGAPWCGGCAFSMACDSEIASKNTKEAGQDQIPEPAPVGALDDVRDIKKDPLDPQIRTGDKVRQVGGSRIFEGVGTVIRTPQGNPEVLVRFANGCEWIAVKNLQKKVSE